MDAILDYVLLHFYSVYQQPSRPFDIHYGLNGTSAVQIRRGNTDFFENSHPFPAKAHWQEWKGKQIPFFFDETAASPLLSFAAGRAVIHCDVISSAFFLLSGWQEYHSNSRDQFNRFPLRSSVQHRYGFITLPAVNYYFDLLKTAIEQAYGITLTPALWGGGAFATCLTHDVDRLESAWKIASQAKLGQGQLQEAARLVWQKMKGRDAWFNLEEVMEVLHQYGAKATFFFLCHHQKYNGHPNADYAISSPRYQQLLAEVERQGHEIGVHGSFEAALNTERLRQESRKLNRPVPGNRFHYLCFDPRITPAVLEESGVGYDSTLGFSEHFGFRHSYCLPFRPFDFKNRRPYRFLEIPLNLMDVTLNHPHYLQIPPPEMVQAVEPMLGEIFRFRGCFTLLWHNENFLDHAFAGARQVLERIISAVSSQNTVFLSCSEVSAQMAAAGLFTNADQEID